MRRTSRRVFPSAPPRARAGEKALARSNRVPRGRRRSPQWSARASPRARRLFVLADASAHAHHLGERPEGHAFAVRGAAAMVPQEVVNDTIGVLVDLPGEPALTDTGNSRDGDETSAAIPAKRIERVLQHTQLLVATNERRFNPFRPLCAARLAHDAQGTPCPNRHILPFQHQVAEFAECDRMIRCEIRRFSDEHRSWRRRRLQSRRRVDEVSCHESLGGISLIHGCFTGEHARSRRETSDPDLPAESSDRVDEVEPAAHRPLGVVFVRDRRAPDGENGVADEVVDDTPVPLHDRPRHVGKAHEQVAHLLGIACLGDTREADEIGEERRDQASFRGRRRGSPPLGRLDRGHRDTRGSRREGGSALLAEALTRRRGGAAIRTGERERGTAIAAETSRVLVLGAARRTVQQILPGRNH